MFLRGSWRPLSGFVFVLLTQLVKKFYIFLGKVKEFQKLRAVRALPAYFCLWLSCTIHSEAHHGSSCSSAGVLGHLGSRGC